ncbi:MAG: hypothetical protein SGILL_007835 [Bacillariaceae sp.]
MYTHRYVRSRLVEDNPRDRYDLNPSRNDFQRNSRNDPHGNRTATQPHETQQQQQQQFPQEYWTNGRTTLLHVPVDSSGRGFASPCSSGFFADHTFKMTRNNENSTGENRPIAKTTATATDTNTATFSTANNQNVIRNSLLAGSAAGMASTIACHPFDVLRVKMQSSASVVASTSSTAAAAASINAKPLGIYGTLRSTIQYGGLRALYTGLALPLAAQAVYKGTVFTVNNLTESFIKDWKTQENYKLGNFHGSVQLTIFDRFLSGFMGGAVNAALFCTPVEYVRNQQIAQIGASSRAVKESLSSSHSSTTAKSILHRTTGPLAVIRQTVNAYGVSGLWRGLGSTVLRDSVGCGFFFVAMAQSQVFLTATYGGDPVNPKKPTTSTIILSGAAAGVAYWLWALPIDTCKTWIQSGTAANLSHAIEMSQGGGLMNSIPSLFRGWQVAYTRGAPSAAITVTTYSFVMQHLEQQQY